LGQRLHQRTAQHLVGHRMLGGTEVPRAVLRLPHAVSTVTGALGRLFDEPGVREHPQVEADAVRREPELGCQICCTRMLQADQGPGDAPTERMRVGLEHRLGGPGRLRVRIVASGVIRHAPIISATRIAQGDLRKISCAFSIAHMTITAAPSLWRNRAYLLWLISDTAKGLGGALV